MRHVLILVAALVGCQSQPQDLPVQTGSASPVQSSAQASQPTGSATSTASAQAQPTGKTAPIVTITDKAVLFGEESKPLIDLPARDKLAREGVDARYKRSGPNDLYLVPLAEKLAALRKADPPTSETSKVTIIGDVETPYRMLLEVIYTVGQAGFDSYDLMAITKSAGDGGAPGTSPGRSASAPSPEADERAAKRVAKRLARPDPTGRQPRESKNLREWLEASPSVAVYLGDKGIAVKGPKGALAPGCTTVTGDAEPVTVPKKNGRQDWPGLIACAQAVSKAAPKERHAVLSAPGAAPYRDILSAIDALRGEAESPVFSVSFGVGPGKFE